MIEVIMPKLGLTMEEGTIIRWLKAEGERVEKGEPLFEVQTDKVNMEVEAPASGTLGKILAAEGKTVPVVQVIAYILAPDEEAPARWPTPEPAVQAPAKEYLTTPLTVEATPAAKRLAREKGVDLSQVRGSGPEGRITEQDILDIMAAEVLLTPIQRLTAERMTVSFTSAPHFYLTIEARATKLVELRESLLLLIEEKASVRLTFTDMLIVLVAKALREHPLANASWEEGKIRIAKDINIGLATAVEGGLIVPVIKRADQKDLLQITKERSRLADKASQGKLSLEDVERGTFTLSNLGMFGVDEFGAIINPPQSAILAVGRITERPVAEDGQVVARPTIRLTLSVDHRVLNGAEGARFLSNLKRLIEEPEGHFPF